MKTHLMVALAACTVGAAAQAVPVTTGGGFTYEFLDFSGNGGYVIQPTNACPGPGADHRCDPMTFNGGVGGQLTATANGTNLVYQDLPQSDRGLGVVSQQKKDGNTWISGDETLTLTFANMVNLVGYHIYQRGNAQGWPDEFKVSVDGGQWEYRSIASLVYTSDNGHWLTGKSFSFMAADEEKFYVGAVKITSAIPEPETYALMLAGLGMLGIAARRRRTKD